MFGFSGPDWFVALVLVIAFALSFSISLLFDWSKLLRFEKKETSIGVLVSVIFSIALSVLLTLFILILTEPIFNAFY